MPLLVLLACRGEQPPQSYVPPPTDIPDLLVPNITDIHVIGDAAAPADVLVAVNPDPTSQETLEEEVLPALVNGLRGSVDPAWRVGITSTALGDLNATAVLAPTGADGDRWLSSEDVEHLTVDWTDFPDTAPYGSTGATYLTATGEQEGFRQPDATLFLVLLGGLDETPEAIVAFDDWAAWVADEDAVVSAVTEPESDLAGVVAASGGVSVDPLGDHASWAASVGLLPAGAPLSYALTRLPVEGTVTVRVQTPDGPTFEFMEAVGDPSTGDWIYLAGANAIAFTAYLPETGATVILTYEPRD